GSPTPNGTSGFDLDAVALVHALPADATGLAADPVRLRLRAGAHVPVPRADALRPSGPLHGVEVKVRSEGPVAIEGAPLRGVGPGVAQVVLTAGPFEARAEVEVIP